MIDRYIWKVLSLVLVLCPLMMLLFYRTTNAILQPIASIRVGGPIAALCTFVIAFFISSLRDDLHAREQLRQFKEDPGRPLPVWALLFFVAAVLLAFWLAFGLAAKDTIAGPEGLLEPGSLAQLLFKLVMTGCLIFVFVFLALSAGLMDVYEYGKHLGTKVYKEMDELRKMVLASVRTELDLGQDPLTISNMKRLGDGGISVTLRRTGKLVQQGDIRFIEDKTWTVEADRKGNLTKIHEEKSQVTQIVDQVPV